MLLGSISKIDVLLDRSEMLDQVRSFFKKKGIIEVDPFSLHCYGQVEPHIDLIEAKVKGKSCFLHSSPEHSMKRLLAQGMQEIFFLGHVFRDGEVSDFHQPEFCMIEWYRKISFDALIEETIALAQLFLGSQEVLEFSYKGIFEHILGFYPKKEEREECFLDLEQKMQELPFVVVKDFPEDQAALAKVVEGKAKRFELFFQGVELANGYDELLDPNLYRERFIESNQVRKRMGKKSYPLDEDFLQGIDNLPDCTGVAMGFDRLMMLRHRKKKITEVMGIEREW